MILKDILGNNAKSFDHKNGVFDESKGLQIKSTQAHLVMLRTYEPSPKKVTDRIFIKFFSLKKIYRNLTEI
jgi:hypothetical protein